MNHLTELVITCGSWQEAQRMADALLEKRLVTSVETFEIKTKHWWEGHPHGVKEVKLIVLCRPEQFSSIRLQADKLRRTTSAPVSLAELIRQ